jgi:polar amino acid transport system substrate-binding protein
MILTLAGCSSKPQEDTVPVEKSRIGAMTGTTGDMFVEKNYPDAKLQRYDAIPDAVMALQGGKVDYVITAYTTALNYVRANSDLEIVPGDLLDEGAAIATAKNNIELLEDISSVLERFKGDGTLDEIISSWIKEDGSDYTQIIIPARAGAKPLKVGVAANREPICFVQDNKIVGLDCELIERIANELYMNVEYMDMQFSALIAALESGKVDVVISNVTATEERKLKVNFTEDYFKNPQVLLKKKAS